MQIFKKHKEKKSSMRITPEFVSSLKENEIFVFGYCRSGRHWEGAAAYVMRQFGAVYSQSNGIQGQTYAIATTGVDLTEIRNSVDKFLE